MAALWSRSGHMAKSMICSGHCISPAAWANSQGPHSLPLSRLPKGLAGLRRFARNIAGSSTSRKISRRSAQWRAREIVRMLIKPPYGETQTELTWEEEEKVAHK